MLTLRQIEVIRAIMVAGTVNGAAELLNVSAPGISRIMKHAESQLGIRLFARRHGRFIPTREARTVFGQLNEVFDKVEGLQFAIDQLKQGVSATFSFASVPSISQFILPRAVKRLRGRFPDLRMDINILKIEEAIDYLLLKRGEVVAMTSKIDHPGLQCQALAMGRLVSILPEGHPLAERETVSIDDLADHPLVGIDGNDPYGRIIASAFETHGHPFNLSIQARFAQTVLALVRHGLGVAIIDEFSVCGRAMPGVVRRPLAEQTSFRVYAVFSNDEPLSMFAEDLVGHLRTEMRAAVQNPPWGQPR
ncbi:MAG: LysR family transcriptional regulator [Rhodobacterales bacterium]|nr:LysR family transcriptional regulator [Rhodobacterales bacterium]